MNAVQPAHDPAFDPDLVDVDMHLVPPTAPVTGVVTRNELCLKGKSASFIRHVCVDVSGTPLEGAFKALKTATKTLLGPKSITLIFFEAKNLETLIFKS